MSTVYFDSQLPWSSSTRENQRFSRITTVALVVTLLMALAVKLIDVPDIPREEQEKLPPQLARLIKPIEVEPVEIEPPVVEEQPEPEVEKVPPEVKPKPEETPVEVAKPERPAPTPAPEENVQQARETASKSGLLAYQDDLLSMRDTPNLNNLADTTTIEGAGQAEQTKRKRVVSDEATQTSGGVASTEVSSNIGARGELEGRRTTELDAPESGAASLAAKRIEQEAQVIGNRDLDSIRKILDANKGGVYALYRRALRADPTLQGKLTILLTIEPSGVVGDIKIVHSELNAPALEAKLLGRIAMIDFGAQNVSQTQLEYAFHFLPN